MYQISVSSTCIILGCVIFYLRMFEMLTRDSFFFKKKSFSKYWLGIGTEFPQFLKWFYTYFWHWCYMFVLWCSQHYYKIKLSTLKSFKDVLCLAISNIQPRFKSLYKNKQAHSCWCANLSSSLINDHILYTTHTRTHTYTTMVAHAFNPSSNTEEAEARRFLWVLGQLGLYKEF